MEKDNLCIYHNNCADGFGAAWVMRKWAIERNMEMTFLGATYQNDPPNVEGKNVFIVDFSYKRPVLEEMVKKARTIVVIDHHKSAQEDLADGKLEADNFGCLFDMNHSGAMLTWLWCFGDNVDPPPLIRVIEDRDLWKFQLENTREVQAAIFSYPYDFEVWDKLMNTSLEVLCYEGRSIERKHFKDIAELVEASMRMGYIAGYHVPMVNLPYIHSSDAGQLMAKLYAPETFAACYMDTKEGRVFSLRSTEQGMDVSAIAKQFGGGGHKHAAGFRIPHKQYLHDDGVHVIAV